MNNLMWKQFASKYFFCDDTMHVSTFELDVVVATSRVPKVIGITKRGPAALFCGVEESGIMAIDKP
jgi:hypothetical protein